MTYGPIEASMDVYDDFPSYKSGKSALIWMTYSSTIVLNFFLRRFGTDHFFYERKTIFVHITDSTNSVLIN